jgi:hypothetical protein
MLVRDLSAAYLTRRKGLWIITRRIHPHASSRPVRSLAEGDRRGLCRHIIDPDIGAHRLTSPLLLTSGEPLLTAVEDMEGMDMGTPAP